MLESGELATSSSSGGEVPQTLQAYNRLVDCHFFVAGEHGCSKGQECEFRHSQAAKDNPKVCKFWLQEDCLDPDCTFRHPTLPRQKDGSRTFCYYQSTGRCTRRAVCAFYHGDEPPGKLVYAALLQPDLVEQPTQLPSQKQSAGSPAATLTPLPSTQSSSSSTSTTPAAESTNNNPSKKRKFVKSLEELLQEKGEAQTTAPTSPAPKEDRKGKAKADTEIMTQSTAKTEESQSNKKPRLAQQQQREQAATGQIAASTSGGGRKADGRVARRAKSPATNGGSGGTRPSFGVKSLNEILKERDQISTPSSASSSSSSSLPSNNRIVEAYAKADETRKGVPRAAPSAPLSHDTSELALPSSTSRTVERRGIGDRAEQQHKEEKDESVDIDVDVDLEVDVDGVEVDVDGDIDDAELQEILGADVTSSSGGADM
ncbi:Zinc finger CCCH domain-containing protein 34 [Balamuthia mandrillaris]